MLWSLGDGYCPYISLAVSVHHRHTTLNTAEHKQIANCYSGGDCVFELAKDNNNQIRMD